MYILNKIVGLLLSPAVVTMMIFIAAFIAALRGRRRLAIKFFGAAALWFLVWSSPVTYRYLASGLEMRFPVLTAEEVPVADAIVILGGGVGCNTNEYPYGEMWTSADRVWHGARLYKAGKAPKIFITGGGTTFGTVMLLQDFGVPKEVIVCNLTARNTEEEARFIAGAMNEVAVKDRGLQGKAKILLVTSAWHMRRAKLMFEKYAPELEVIPAATDYEALVRCGWRSGFEWSDLTPNAEMLFYSSYMIKEIIGYWGYRWFRR